MLLTCYDPQFRYIVSNGFRRIGVCSKTHTVFTECETVTISRSLTGFRPIDAVIACFMGLVNVILGIVCIFFSCDRTAFDSIMMPISATITGQDDVSIYTNCRATTPNKVSYKRSPYCIICFTAFMALVLAAGLYSPVYSIIMLFQLGLPVIYEVVYAIVAAAIIAGAWAYIFRRYKTQGKELDKDLDRRVDTAIW